MARTFWFAAGAAAGVYAYKRGTAAVEEAKERTLGQNVRSVAGATASAGRRAKRAAQVTGRIVAESRGDRLPGEIVAEIDLRSMPTITSAEAVDGSDAAPAAGEPTAAPSDTRSRATKSRFTSRKA